MGAACCAVAKDRTKTDGPRGEALQRHICYSPSWSIRWDNRIRLAEEEAPANCLHDGDGGNDRTGVKSCSTVQTAFASEQGGPLDSSRSSSLQKSPVSERNVGILRLPATDQAVSQDLVEVKEWTETPSVLCPSVKLSPSAPSVSSVSASPPTSQSKLLPTNLTPLRLHHHSLEHQQLHRVSDSWIPEYKSPTFSISEFAWGDESTRGSNDATLDSWTNCVMSELMTLRGERWSFDSENSGFGWNKMTRSSGRNSGSPSINLQTCGVCTKLLTERSSWVQSSQKIISSNELIVVSVLSCGHVYHAECLEHVTPEISKYDPACPVCTYGEKWAVKMSEKALKAEVGLQARKKSRRRVGDSSLDSDFILDHHKHSGVEKRGPKISFSGSMKISLGKPFLKRLISSSSEPSRSFSQDQSTRRKGLFRATSCKG